MGKDKGHPMSTDMNDVDLTKLNNLTESESKLLRRDAPSVESSKASKPSKGHRTAS